MSKENHSHSDLLVMGSKPAAFTWRQDEKIPKIRDTNEKIEIKSFSPRLIILNIKQNISYFPFD